MPFTLEHVVPWGRSFDEYLRMFDLTDEDLGRSILGCADGPAAFNARLTLRGGRVVSCDPLYRYSAHEIEARIDACFGTVLQQARRNEEAFVWSTEIPDVQSLGRVRMTAMGEFLADFCSGKQANRYIEGELPSLPFPNRLFDLALCSHFLFLYDDLGAEFHLRSILELLRVAGEVRIFPLVQLDGQPSPFVDAAIAEARSRSCSVAVETVPYEFQRGANEMLRIRRPA
jgi:hypothetical protein